MINRIAGLNKTVKITINMRIVSNLIYKVNCKGFVLGAIYNKSKQIILLLLTLTTFSTNCLAEDFFSNVRFDGYISQSFIHTTDNNFFGKSDDDISLDFTEIELLLSTTFLRNFQFSGSLLSRHAGESDNGDIRLDHGFITYTAFNNIDWSIGARVGRIKAPHGFYNETRDVAFTRPGILAPQSMYLERYRNWMFAADGVEFFTSRNWSTDSLSLRLLYSNKDPDREVVEEFLSAFPINIAPNGKNGKTGVAKLLYDHDTGKIRLGLSYGFMSYDIDNSAIGLQDTQMSSSAVFLSGEYNTQNWKFVGEYAPIKVKVSDLPGGFPDQNKDGLSYYLQTTYRINPQFELFLRRGVLLYDKDDKHGEMLAQITGAPAHSFYAKNWVIGTGWYFSDSLLFRLEYSDIEGTGWVPSKDYAQSVKTGSLKKDWEMVMFQASYRF